MRLEVMFPSCWNGKDTDSANHNDHLAYPQEVRPYLACLSPSPTSI